MTILYISGYAWQPIILITYAIIIIFARQYHCTKYYHFQVTVFLINGIPTCMKCYRIKVELLLMQL